jgi:hypothetical protein
MPKSFEEAAFKLYNFHCTSKYGAKTVFGNGFLSAVGAEIGCVFGMAVFAV